MNASRTRKGPEDPSEARKKRQAFEGSRENAACCGSQDQTEIVHQPPTPSNLPIAHSILLQWSSLSWDLAPAPVMVPQFSSMRDLPTIQNYQSSSPHHPIRVRAHSLLCLQGFRGKGYSEGFVKNMAAIHQQLADDPSQWVEIIVAPDAICSACPHLVPSGCSLHGTDSEHAMQAQDRDVLARLDLHEGDHITWAEVLDRIRTSLTGESLTNICGRCQWLSLGYCRDGIDVLASQTQCPTLRSNGPKKDS